VADVEVGISVDTAFVGIAFLTVECCIANDAAAAVRCRVALVCLLSAN
jgi:hypothetical protein